ncbi:hypothetical protein ACFV5N_00775 [Streptomyces sp. NPDC059853]|uniref:hypothetical protein n=1 Tax=Streptomyces TaxID=1883 RepID=UPI00364B05D9
MEPGQTPAQPGTAPAENPYLRYRTERREWQVPYSADGVHFEMVNAREDVRVPIPPRDWDLIVLRLITAAVYVMLAVTLIWSVASIGGLLSGLTWTPIAYSVAVGYDLSWMVCLGLEWLARYDERKRRAPFWAGNVFLVVSFAGVIVHGLSKVNSAWIATLGALICVISKALWMLLMHHTAMPLSAENRQWMRGRSGRIGARLAMASHIRTMARMEAKERALMLALGAPGQLPGMQSGQADSPIPTAGQAPAAPVLTSADTRPDTAPALSGPVPPVPAPQVPQPPAVPSTPPQPTQPPANDEQDQEQKRYEVVPIERGNLTAALRKLLAAGITDPTTAHRMVVEAGLHDAKADSVSRTMRRLQRSA